MKRLEALKGFLDKIWEKARYSAIFYESIKFFDKELPKLASYLDDGGARMKSFVDSMPEATREIYKEVLVKPVVKMYEIKLKEIELEVQEKIAEKERSEKERAIERERAEKERAIEKERAEKERAEKEKIESALKMTCQEAVAEKFPDISPMALLLINKLEFMKCNQLIRQLNSLANANECEKFLQQLTS